MTTETKLYQSEDSQIQLDVLVEHETVWLNQTQMTLLFQRDVSVISRHIRNIFEERELPKECNLHFLQIANSDRPVAFYSLDVTISVGYRITSKRGTEFRIWATQVLKEYLYRGYAKKNPDSSPAQSLGEERPGLRCKNIKLWNTTDCFLKKNFLLNECTNISHFIRLIQNSL